MKVCGHPDCPEITEGKFCSIHQRERWRDERKRYRRNYYGPEWPAISASHLASNPYCECTDKDCRCFGEHFGREIPATEVDHRSTISLFPKTKSGRAAAHSESNRISLCGTCHRSKTMRIDVHGRRSSRRSS